MDEFWILASEGNHSADDERHVNYWLRVKDDAGDEEESIVKVDDNAHSVSYVELDLHVAGPSLNRFIYTVGHAEKHIGPIWIKDPSKDIYRLDTCNLELGWEKLDVGLRKGRLNPHIVQLDGRFYIFEAVGVYGSAHREIHPIEVYDPVTETIELLVETRVNTANYCLLGVDHDCKRIVFSSALLETHLALYSPYNEDDNKWEIKEIPFDLYGIMGSFGTIRMYCLDGDHHLVAYNLEYNMFSAPVSLGFISNYTTIMSVIDRRDLTQSVNHLEILYHMTGDRFCFFWYRAGPDSNKMYCTFLDISNSFADGRFVLVVSELATHSYKIPSYGFGIRSVTPLASAAIGN